MAYVTEKPVKSSSKASAAPDKLPIETYVLDVLNTIEREREREIISRRYGLFDRKETLEQVGELLAITRERVRQLEKTVMARLKAQADKGELPHIADIEQRFAEQIAQIGGVARTAALGKEFTTANTKLDQSRVAFLAELAPSLVVLEDTDTYHHTVGLLSLHDGPQIKKYHAQLVEAVKKHGKPADIKTMAAKAELADQQHAQALAQLSKQLATLNNQWGLVRWPMVNPKNIRDKIYVILKDNGKHMHFNEIASSIRDSGFKRSNVTTQAIHNELIKDKRFVLIGRGIYALKEWGYEKGTVADIITEILQKAQEPLHRDEIVKRVLENRFVKETTILLNLQGKPQFKRVAKATYTLDEPTNA